MERYTDARDAQSPDQFWLLEHDAVYTQGTSCNDTPRSNPDSVPVVKTNRGGQITWHGPGQLIIYLLLDLKRLGIGPKSLVYRIEQAILTLLGEFSLVAERRSGAPGIYVEGSKIAALGLRIRHGRCFHGLSLNVAPNLTAFDHIDPCGYPGLAATSLEALGVAHGGVQVTGERLSDLLETALAQA